MEGASRTRRLWAGVVVGLLTAVLPSGRAVARLQASRSSRPPHLELLERREADLRRWGRTPAGVVALEGLLRLSEWVPTAELERVVRAAQGRGRHPLVRTYADYLASRLALRRGELKAAAALQRRAGFLRGWRVCGPFDGRGGEALERTLEVERELAGPPSLTRRYRGAGGRWVRWRAVPFPNQHAAVPVGALVKQGSDAVAYLQVVVRSKRRQAAALRIGAPGRFKVFLNGVEAGGGGAPRGARPDQDALGLWLRRGDNRLVIKSLAERGGWSIYARLTRIDGGPLSGISAGDPASKGGDGAAIKRPGQRRTAAPRGPTAWLAQRLGRRARQIDLLRLRALHQARAEPLDPGSKAAEELVRSWVDPAQSVEALLLLADATREPNERRVALERARALAPHDPWVATRLARWLQTQGRPLQAAAALAALAASTKARGEPPFLPAELERAEGLREAGLTHLAAGRLQALMTRYPTVGRVLVERANLALEQNDTLVARRLLQRQLQRDQDDVSTLRTLASLMVRRGEARPALRHLQRALRLSPNLVFIRVERARIQAGAGALAEAAAEYRRALRIDPRAERVLVELGKILLRAGDRTAAWTAFRKALALRPQNAELRGYLAFLDPRRQRGAAERHRADLAPLLARALASPASTSAPATVLLDLTSTEVHDNGLSRTLRQRLVQVGTAAGALQVSSHSIQFNPERQLLQIRAARVHRPGGKVMHSSLQLEQDASEPWAGQWYDLRTRVIRFAGLVPGDVIEIEYVLEDVAHRNLFADYFGEIVFLQEDLPVRRFSYTLVTPRRRRFHFRHPRSAGVRRAVTARADRRIYSWTVKDLPRVVAEPGMPGWSEVADYLHASTYSSWEEVGRWYWGLIKPQLRATKAVADKARELTRKLVDDGAKIRAIHNYVAKTTRYVGLEFGIHSYKPYAAAQVLARKFGDCKDKAALMVALLGQVGVPAEIALVRTRRRGAVERSPASLAPFDHAVVYLPRQRVYLDATEEFAGTGELPVQDQGVMALHIERGKGVLRLTPLQPAARNLSRATRVIRIAQSGGARVTEERTIAGHLAPRFRERYQAADHRRSRYEKSWGRSVGGVKVIKVAMPGIDDLERPVLVRGELEVRGLCRQTGRHRLALLPTGLKSNLTGRYARLSRRRHALVVDHPWRVEERVRLLAPPGWRFAAPPERRSVSSEFGRFVRTIRRQGAALVVDQQSEISAGRVPAARYEAFRRFLKQVDRHAAEEVILAR